MVYSTFLLRWRWAGGAFHVAHISTHQASPFFCYACCCQLYHLRHSNLISHAHVHWKQCVLTRCHDRQPPHLLENFDKQVHSSACPAPSKKEWTVMPPTTTQQPYHEWIFEQQQSQFFQDFQVQGHSSNVKHYRGKMTCPCIPTLHR